MMLVQNEKFNDCEMMQIECMLIHDFELVLRLGR